MELVAFIGGIYSLILLFRATRKYGSFSKMPEKEITNISARFGIFIGLALAIKSASILADALAGVASGWFLGGIVGKGVFVGALGLYIFVRCLRHVKHS